MSEPIIIGDEGPPIVITVSEFKGKLRLDIRKHYTDAAGELKPTRKGINLTIEDGQAEEVLLAAQTVLLTFQEAQDAEAGKDQPPDSD